MQYKDIVYKQDLRAGYYNLLTWLICCFIDMFHSQKKQYVSRETLGGYSETVYRYMEGAGEFYGG